MIFPMHGPRPEDFAPPQSLVDAFPPGMLFAGTGNGFANKKTLDKVIDHIIDTLGDVENKPGKRIVIKLDGGPALQPIADPYWLLKQRNRGVVIYPCLPCGSLVNQVRCRCTRLFCSTRNNGLLTTMCNSRVCGATGTRPSVRCPQEIARGGLQETLDGTSKAE